MAHVKLALKGMQAGVDHIPDKVFENIPYVGPKYFREGDENQNQKNRTRGNSNSSDSSESDAERGAKSSRSRNERRDQDSRRARSHDDRRTERSRDGPTGGYDANPYFPPPPVNPAAQRSAYLPRPYDPREYGANPGTRDDYYYNHPQERQPFVPPPPIPPQQSASSPAPPSTAGASYSTHDDRRSSIADRYRPSNYEPGYGELVPRSRSAYDGGYDSEMADRRDSQSDSLRHPHNTYYPPSFGNRDDDSYRSRSPSPSRRRSSSHRRDSRNRFDHDGTERSESSWRSGGDRVKEEFNKHKKDIGASALGAIAGGIIGNQFAKKNSKMGILVGAALGGIGGGLIERERENRKERKQLEHRWSSGRLKDSNDGF